MTALKILNAWHSPLITCVPAMLPIQYDMKVVADMTDTLVRPAVFELIRAHAENVGMDALNEFGSCQWNDSAFTRCTLPTRP